jgi:hypothetical protein
MKRIYLTAALLIGIYTQCIHGQVSMSVIGDSTLSSGMILLNSSDDRIHIYPNPSKGTFYFNGAKGKTIEVYNLLGQRIYQAEADRDKYPIDLSSQVKGIYSYRIIDDAELVQKGKIVVN